LVSSGFALWYSGRGEDFFLILLSPSSIISSICFRSFGSFTFEEAPICTEVSSSSDSVSSEALVSFFSAEVEASGL
jgi:hypothetical protein